MRGDAGAVVPAAACRARPLGTCASLSVTLCPQTVSYVREEGGSVPGDQGPMNTWSSVTDASRRGHPCRVDSFLRRTLWGALGWSPSSPRAPLQRGAPWGPSGGPVLPLPRRPLSSPHVSQSSPAIFQRFWQEVVCLCTFPRWVAALLFVFVYFLTHSGSAGGPRLFHSG